MLVFGDYPSVTGPRSDHADRKKHSDLPAEGLPQADVKNLLK